MFCSKCGNKNEDGALFCRNCGSAIETVQANVQSMAQPQTQSQYQPNQNYQPMPPTTPNANKNKNKYIGIVVVALAAILLIFFVASILGGYSNRTPEKATKSVFKAISDQNYDEFVTLVSGGDVDDLIDEFTGASYENALDAKKEFKKMIKNQLEEIDEELEDEFGKNWHNKIKIIDVEEEIGRAHV